MRRTRPALTSLVVLVLGFVGLPALSLFGTPPASAAGATALVINEIFVDHAGDDDWVEIYNTSTEPVDLDGLSMTIRPLEYAPSVEISLHGTVPGNGFQVVDAPLAANYSVELVGAGGLDQFVVPTGATLPSLARCSDGYRGISSTAAWVRATAATPGGPNECNVVLINEIEVTPADGQMWMELVNTGATPQDLTGSQYHNGGASWPLSDTLAPGEIKRYPVPSLDTRFNVVALQIIEGWGYDELRWGGAVPPATSWGRCPNASGEPHDYSFVPTLDETPGMPNACERVPTELAAEPAVRLLPLGLGQLRATLTSESTPVGGAQVEFRVGVTQICRSTTNASGVATCNASAHVLSILLAGGYTASFAGDALHEPSSARGRLIG